MFNTLCEITLVICLIYWCALTIKTISNGVHWLSLVTLVSTYVTKITMSCMCVLAVCIPIFALVNWLWIFDPVYYGVLSEMGVLGIVFLYGTYVVLILVAILAFIRFLAKSKATNETENQ